MAYISFQHYNPAAHSGKERPLYNIPSSMNDKYVIIADQSHLRIFQETIGLDMPPLYPIAMHDLPEGKGSYTERDSDMAARFPASQGRRGMSIDERLPMKEERERHISRKIADLINASC